MELQLVVARPNPSARSSVRATSTMQRNWLTERETERETEGDVSWHAPRTKSSSNRARAAASIDADRCDRASASESTVESGCEYRCVQRLSLTSVAAWRPGGTSQGQVVDHLARSFDHLLRRLQWHSTAAAIEQIACKTRRQELGNRRTQQYRFPENDRRPIKNFCTERFAALALNRSAAHTCLRRAIATSSASASFWLCEAERSK